MSFTKVEYKDQETIISAKNMNDIQDAVLALEDGLFTVEDDRSGEVITITDASTRGFRSLNIYGKTIQDGTPTPNAPVDLVSIGDDGSTNITVVGKNLFDVSRMRLGEPSLMTRTATGFSFTRGTFSGGTFASFEVPILKSQTITFSCNGSAYQPTLILYKDFMYGTQLKTVTDVGVLTYTAAENLPNAVFSVIIDSNDEDCVVSDIQIELGTTPTAYEPYKGQTLTISTPNGLPGIPVTSGGNYTDANGQQWICDEIDLARGVYVQRVEVLSFAVADMNNSENYPGWRNAGFTKHYPNESVNINHLGAVSMCNISAEPPYINTLGSNDVLLVPGYNGTTQSEWQANFPNLVVEIVFSIPTPIETPLPEEEIIAYSALRTYKDHTTVSNDGLAYMELEYVMDAKKYIDGLFAGTIIPATVE